MREGKEEDSELCPGTLQHYEKKDAAKENKKEKTVKKITKKVVSKNPLNKVYQEGSLRQILLAERWTKKRGTDLAFGYHWI